MKMRFLKFLGWFLVCCLLVGGVFGLPDVVVPVFVDVDVFSGEVFSGFFNVSNAGSDVSVLNFSGVDGIVFGSVFNLSGNGSVEVPFSVLKEGVGDFASEVWGRVFYESLQDYEGVVVDVNVSGVGFVPANFSVSVGDHVVFHNVDVVGHSVSQYPLGSGFSVDLDAGGVWDFFVESDGVVVFRDSVSGFLGEFVSVVPDEVVLAHNADLDRRVVFRVRSVFRGSNLSLSWLDGQNFSVGWNGSVKGGLRVSDVDGNGCFGVTLSSSDGWLIFGRNNFNVGGGSFELVDFWVKPSGVVESNQTGRVYDLPVRVDSLNCGVEDVVLSVFVEPFSFDYDVMVFDIITDAKVRAVVKELCLNTPYVLLSVEDKALCDGLRVNETVTEVRFENVSLSGDVQSVEDIDEKLGSIEGLSTTGFNVLNKRLNDIENVTSFLNDGYGDYQEELRERKQERLDARRDAIVGFVWKFFAVILLGCLVVKAWFTYVVKRKRAVYGI